MTNVITLPEREKLTVGSQHQRVFYLGFVYRGPPLMQEVQNVYLKRHGRKEGTRRWSIITYGKFDEWYKPDEVTFDDLWEMGWDGDISKWRDAKMYDFSSGQLIKREEYED